jgi:hypothetical protein
LQAGGVVVDFLVLIPLVATYVALIYLVFLSLLSPLSSLSPLLQQKSSWAQLQISWSHDGRSPS